MHHFRAREECGQLIAGGQGCGLLGAGRSVICTVQRRMKSRLTQNTTPLSHML